ncbi:SpoIIE family protein phosphatase [Kitasatospora sp. HPMI-4]|uniref:SpoIIE family protein phosphatase n=1 Tax=Kitasatospora sp. HPMI-4 TaxID=3448443 RepID=UPI003F1E1DE1
MARALPRSFWPFRRRPSGRRERRQPDAVSPASSARHRLGMRSLAGQMFLQQVLIVLLLVVAAVAALLIQARSDQFDEARDRSLGAAESFSHTPGLPAAMRLPDPTAVLQPRTEVARRQAGIDFLVVTNRDGIRYTHPEPQLIGKKFVGTIGPSLQGRTTIESVQGPLGHELQVIVPAYDEGGNIIGIVSAGVKVSGVSSAINRQLPVLLITGAAALALATAGTGLVNRRLRRQTHGLGPAEMTRMYEHHDAVLHAVREGVVIVGGTGRILLANDQARRLLDLPADAEGRAVGDPALRLTPRMAELLASRRIVTDEVVPLGGRLLAINNRPTDRKGGPPGSVATLRDTTELHILTGTAEIARNRLRLLYDASLAIGTTLDIRRTAQELTQIATPRLADYVTVDLAEPVLEGEEPQALVSGTAAVLRRVALTGPGPSPLYPAGGLQTFAGPTPQATGFVSGHPVLVPDLSADNGWRNQDRERTQDVIDFGFHSLITVPLRARGVLMGVVNFWRTRESEPFDEDDLSLAEELTNRAALAIDNARRYTREHTLATTLQRHLLPRTLPPHPTLDIAHRYLPAPTGASGDWYDVIPLPGTRTALVIGDVVGHGLHAAATMGRLRTAVQNFSTLDLPPGELLAHLDQLVSQLDQEASETQAVIAGATCLYAIYDPTAGTCTLAGAGHPAPVLVRPDGTVEVPALPANPPLGLGHHPFHAARLRLPEGTTLVLYTNGLITNHTRDLTAGENALFAALADQRGRTPQETCDEVLAALRPTRPTDDTAVLVARTHLLPPDRIADWDVLFAPTAVAAIRTAAARQLARWGLDDEVFTTQVILTELVTNAIQHASGPIHVRLLHYHDTLVCEVSDATDTTPHPRHPAPTDESGRGLLLVTHLTQHWGTRHTPTGKTIWTEQRVAPAGPDPWTGPERG